MYICIGQSETLTTSKLKELRTEVQIQMQAATTSCPLWGLDTSFVIVYVLHPLTPSSPHPSPLIPSPPHPLCGLRAGGRVAVSEELYHGPGSMGGKLSSHISQQSVDAVPEHCLLCQRRTGAHYGKQTLPGTRGEGRQGVTCGEGREQE